MAAFTILSGPIGAGKTTVARAWVASGPNNLVYIEGDTFWSFLATPRRSEKAFRTTMAAMTAASIAYAAAGFDVLLDFSIPPSFLDTVRRLAKLRDLPVDYVVLCPSETVCAARAKKRAAGAIKDYTKYHDLYVELTAVPTAIHDDDTAAKTLAARIRDELASGMFRIT